MILSMLKQTLGTALTVTDDEMLQAGRELASLEGIFAAPEGAATVSAARKLAMSGWIKPSDRVVLFNTGWLERWLRGNVGPFPALTAEAAEYIARKRVIAVGIDAPSVDSDERFSAHRVLLVRSGIYILEYLKTEALARDAVYQFLFVLGQPKIEGAVQMIVNPVAIR